MKGMSMKSKNEIEMNFEKAVSQAIELETLSKELSKLASIHLSGALEMLGNSWHGENSEKFLRNGKLASGEVLDTADDLIKVAKNIRMTAGIIYNAEKTAAQVIY